jgi:hypothetical protein
MWYSLPLKEFRIYAHFKGHNPHRKTARQYISLPHSTSTVDMNFNTAMKYYQQLPPQRGEWTDGICHDVFHQDGAHLLISEKDGKDLHRMTADQNMWGVYFR